jgi:hypothetical protein
VGFSRVQIFQDAQIHKWREFCSKEQSSWVHHYGVSNIKDSNESFLVYYEARLVAIVPFVIEADRASLFGLSLPGAIIATDLLTKEKKLAKKTARFIYESYDQLASEHNLKKVSLNIVHHREYTSELFQGHNELGYFGYLDTSLDNLRLDISLDSEALWRNLTKGHRSDIKKHLSDDLKLREFELSDKESFVKKIAQIEEFEPDHQSYLYELAKNNQCSVLELYSGEQALGGALFLQDKSLVQYHEAQKYDEGPLPVHHLLLWKSIEHFKQLGYQSIDFGVFSFSSRWNFPINNKKRAISTFKRGFAPDVFAFHSGEKFYCGDTLTQELNARAQRLIQNEFPSK